MTVSIPCIFVTNKWIMFMGLKIILLKIIFYKSPLQKDQKTKNCPLKIFKLPKVEYVSLNYHLFVVSKGAGLHLAPTELICSLISCHHWIGFNHSACLSCSLHSLAGLHFIFQHRAKIKVPTSFL